MTNGTPRRLRPRAALAAVAVTATLAWIVGIAPAAAQETVTITVDTTSDVVDFGGAQTVADLPGPDGRTSLREAAVATTNTGGPETIGFDIPTSDPGFTGDGFVVGIDPASPADELTIGDDGTTIDATTQPGGHSITVEGGPDSMADSDDGLHITSSGNAVIGLGVRLYANGILVDGGSNNLITGVTATDNRQGVQIAGREVGIGNEVSGSTVRDSEGSGVLVINSAGAVVDNNTIVGNGTRGVFMSGASDVTVTGNLISQNGFVGIEFQSDAVGIAAGNTITGNEAAGIVNGGAAGFTISRNAIADNDGLGINLLGGREDEFGVTRNSKGGPNFPELREAADDGTATIVEGRVDYADPQSVTVELFASEAPDPSGHGEGQEFVGTATPDRKGRFTVSLPAGLAGGYVTATATGSTGTTSEFSEAVQVAVPKK